MNSTDRFQPSTLHTSLMACGLSLMLAACGGGNDDNAIGAAAPTKITAQATDQAVVAGNTATFTVAATGDGLTYQWQQSLDGGKTFTSIAGATAASYTIAVDAGLSGSQYRAVITGTTGTATSSAVTLTVSPAVTAPAITVDVAPSTVVEGSDAVFSVTAAGTSLGYQWQVSTDGSNWSNVDGATASTLTLTGVVAADSTKQVRVIVTNSVGSVTSAAGLLTVNTAPVVATAPAISTQPASVSVTAPAAASFTVAATGTPAPTYQWKKSTDGGATYVDVAGATGASYSTGMTAVSDTGALFEVAVVNTAGTTLSGAATLTVAAAPAAPTIATQPAAATVTVPAAATFTVVAAGTPTPAYQWQISTDNGATFANIQGATAASYTTPTSAAADTGKQYRVVVTNSGGSVISAAVGLTANAVAAPGTLVGRAWTAGQLIDADDNNAPLVASIDDAGTTTVVLRKGDGTRVYAMRGTPGAAGSTPTWTAPVLIDTAGTTTYSYSASASTPRYDVVSAPNGDAYATWTTSAACTSLSYRTSGNCTYLVLARFNATAAAWEAPTVVADTPNDSAASLTVNAAGDLALLYSGWQRPSTGYVSQPAVALRAHGASTFRFQPLPVSSASIGMDSSGDVAVFGEAAQNSTTDYVAYRGNVSAGLGGQEVIDTRLSAANAEGRVTVGLNGQILAFYSQNDGTSTRFYSVTSPTFTGALTVQDLNKTPPSNTGNQFRVYALDSGDGLMFDHCTVSRWTASSNTWSSFNAVPDNCGSETVAGTTQGNSLRLVESSGRWATYDASTNTMVQAIPSVTNGLPTTGPQFVYGVAAAVDVNGGSPSYRGYTYLLSKSGVGVLLTETGRDVLPTPALPLGDGRIAVSNLWGLFLK